MKSDSYAYPCLVTLSYLGAIYLLFEYIILEKNNILQKAVTYLCYWNFLHELTAYLTLAKVGESRISKKYFYKSIRIPDKNYSL